MIVVFCRMPFFLSVEGGWCSGEESQLGSEGGSYPASSCFTFVDTGTLIVTDMGEVSVERKPYSLISGTFL